MQILSNQDGVEERLSLSPFLLGSHLEGRLSLLCKFTLSFDSIIVGHLGHHLAELLKIDLTIPIHVDLGNDFVPDRIIGLHIVAESLGDLLSIDGATAILVKELEGSLHVLVVEKSVLVDGTRAPLAKINLTTAICVGLVEKLVSHLDDGGLIEILELLQSLVAVDEFVSLDQTIPILIKLVEGLLELLGVLLGSQVIGHEGHHRLLQLSVLLTCTQHTSLAGKICKSKETEH